MTARGFYTLLFGALMLLPRCPSAARALFCWARRRCCAGRCRCCACAPPPSPCRAEQQIEGGQAQRGGACRLILRVRFALPAPIAPLSLKVELPSGRESDFSLPAGLLGLTESDHSFACPHVGVFQVGVSQITFSDCFGLFAFRRRQRGALQSVAVLLIPSLPTRCPSAPARAKARRPSALSDHSVPEDIRAWQEGDEPGRVHWKLSMRRQSLMVHTYETPQRPDALILLDTSQPQGAPRAALIDALTEACAGTVEALCRPGA